MPTLIADQVLEICLPLSPAERIEFRENWGPMLSAGPPKAPVKRPEKKTSDGASDAVFFGASHVEGANDVTKRDVVSMVELLDRIVEAKQSTLNDLCKARLAVRSLV